jgi:hypothetical protein
MLCRHVSFFELSLFTKLCRKGKNISGIAKKCFEKNVHKLPTPLQSHELNKNEKGILLNRKMPFSFSILKNYYFSSLFLLPSHLTNDTPM